MNQQSQGQENAVAFYGVRKEENDASADMPGEAEETVEQPEASIIEETPSEEQRVVDFSEREEAPEETILRTPMISRWARKFCYHSDKDCVTI